MGDAANILEPTRLPGLDLEISVRGRAVIAWVKNSDGGTTAHVFQTTNPASVGAHGASTETKFIGSATWFDAVDVLVEQANKE